MDESVKIELQRLCEEEEKDYQVYEDLSKQMRDLGLHRQAGILHDIAHDESTHLSALKHILEL